MIACLAKSYDGAGDNGTVRVGSSDGNKGENNNSDLRGIKMFELIFSNMNALKNICIYLHF